MERLGTSLQASVPPTTAITKGWKIGVNLCTLNKGTFPTTTILTTATVIIILCLAPLRISASGPDLEFCSLVEKPGPPAPSPSSSFQQQQQQQQQSHHHHHHHSSSNNNNNNNNGETDSVQRDGVLGTSSSSTNSGSGGSSSPGGGSGGGGDGYPPYGEEVLCQIRTLHTDLDFENLTVPILGGAGSVTKLRLLCNDVLFFESALQSGQLTLFPELQELSIEKCKLRYLPSGSLAGLKHLKKLTVGTGNSDWAARSLELSPAALEDVPQVRHLNLAYNHMWSLPEGLLCQVTFLTSLNLTQNLLSDIDDLGLPARDEEQQRRLGVKSSSSSSSSSSNNVACLAELRSFDLSQNTLRTLGRGRLERMKRLQELRLDQNWLEELHDETFLGLSQLRLLNLSSNRLVALPPRLFAQTKLLRELDLRNNSLTVLSGQLLEPLEHLQVLDVSRNALSRTTGEPFRGLVRLVILNLSRNQISTLAPSTFRDLYTLQVLDLSFNQISTIDPETFMSMSNLHSLNLARNRIRTVSAHMFDGLYVLHKLILDYNEITGMDSDALKNCTSLQDLGLVGNKLTAVPSAALRGLGLLRMLDLGENRISHLFNNSFNGLGQLYGLRLVDNEIQMLPRGLCEPITRLRVFNVAQNGINKISSQAFTACPDLRVLRLDSNQLQILPSSLAAQLPSLLWLNASENQLRRVDYGGLPSTLEWLDVSHNQLESLGLGRLGKTALRVVDGSHNLLSVLDQTAVPPSLEVLRLNYNRLSRVATDTLGRASNLRRVEIMGNQLESIPLASLRFPPLSPGRPLPEFLLGGNPFLCDCEMEWLTRINALAITRSHPTVLDLDSIVCRLAYSRTLSHAPLPEMRSQDFLCPYRSHCFALCHCCEFDACDCAMTCPSNCTCYHDDTWSANVVDCARSNQPAIPARLPMDSTEVYLDGNEIRVLKSHTLIGRKNLRVLYLNGSGIEVISNKSFNGLQSLQSLHLEDNHLTALHGFEFDHLSRLRELYLENNRIRTISNNTFLPLKSLEILRLDGNRLAVYSVWQLSLNPYLVEVGLARNEWSCDCQFLHQLHAWLSDNSRKVIDVTEVRCMWNTSRSFGPYLSQYNATCGSEWAHIRGYPFATFEQLLPLVCGVALAVLTLLVLILLLVWKDRVRLWAFTHWGLRGDCCCGGWGASRMDEEKSYDAYLIYSQKDEEFVTDKLAEELETQENYRLCLHHRDLVNEGGDLKSMMWGAVDSAKVIVLVLSRNFWTEWGGGEGHVALGSILGPKKARPKKSIVLIQTEDVPTNLQGVKFKRLEWADRRFWAKLKFLLPEPSSHYHNNIANNTTTTSAASSADKYARPPEAHSPMGYDPKLWPYPPAFVALPPKYQSPGGPKSPPSNSTDSTTVDDPMMVGGSSSGTSGSSFYSPAHHLHIPKSPLPVKQPRVSTASSGGDSYLSVEGEHVYSSLDPPSPQQQQQPYPYSTAQNSQQWSTKMSPGLNGMTGGGGGGGGGVNLKNIHLPNGYTYSPSPKPQPQWHPHPSPANAPLPASSLGKGRKSNGKNSGESVQTYLV